MRNFHAGNLRESSEVSANRQENLRSTHVQRHTEHWQKLINPDMGAVKDRLDISFNDAKGGGDGFKDLERWWLMYAYGVIIEWFSNYGVVQREGFEVSTVL